MYAYNDLVRPLTSVKLLKMKLLKMTLIHVDINPKIWPSNQRIKIFQSVSRCFSLFQKAAHYLTKGGTTEIQLQKM